MPSKVPTNIIPANILGVTSWRRTKSYRFYGCFNLYNYKIQFRFYVACFDYSTCTTTKCTWYFVLDASTNSTYTTTKYKWGFERETTTQWMQIQKGWPTPLFCTKRPLAGNLYCSPSPPLYVAVIWSQLLFGHYQPPLAALPHHLQSTRASCGSCPSSQRVCWKPFRILLRFSVRPGDDCGFLKSWGIPSHHGLKPYWSLTTGWFGVPLFLESSKYLSWYPNNWL